MTYVGAPCIYYGDEIGIEGGSDPDCRRAMPWNEDLWDLDLLRYVQRSTAIRRRFRSLRTGDYQRLYASDGIYAFGRRSGDETVVVALNNSGTAVPLAIPVAGYLADGTRLTDAWNGECSVAQIGNGQLAGPVLAPYGSAVLSCP